MNELELDAHMAKSLLIGGIIVATALATLFA